MVGCTEEEVHVVGRIIEVSDMHASHVMYFPIEVISTKSLSEHNMLKATYL